jgi:transposase
MATPDSSSRSASQPSLGPSPAVPFEEFTHFGGLDWAKDAHHLTVVDRAGKVELDLPFDHTAQGWASFREKTAAFPKLAVAIETSQGMVVEQVLAMDLVVYPLNPKAAERYRDRKRPDGSKTDPIDAWCFADALRTDGHAWRALRPMDPLTMELRLLCRDEIALIAERTALVNRLQATLHEYYPVVLRAFDDWTQRWTWQFVIAFPTPAELANAGKRKWEKFMHTHKLYRPDTAQKRLELFAQAMMFSNPNAAVTAAKSFLAVTLCEQLLTLGNRLEKYRARINALFAKHPDHHLFGSLPGAGEKIAPRLLGEIGSDREVFESAEGLQSYAGVAPVTQKSGKSHYVSIRRACNKVLRSTIHLWSGLTLIKCAWAEAYYRQKRKRGLGHAAALRCLGNRWLKIVWKMWQDGKPYDEARHTLDQVKHGSWVVKLLPEPAKA